jgi:hypothetical protein
MPNFPFVANVSVTTAQMNALPYLVPGPPAINPSPPAATTGGFILQAGVDAANFTSGYAPNYNFPQAFPNGLLSVTLTPQYTANTDAWSLNVAGVTLTYVTIACNHNGTAYTGPLSVFYIAVGW